MPSSVSDVYSVINPFSSSSIFLVPTVPIVACEEIWHDCEPTVDVEPDWFDCDPGQDPVIPLIGKNPESKFLFEATVDDQRCHVLLDTGCTAMIMSSSFAARRGFKTFAAPPCSFVFANSSTDRSSLATSVEFECAGYSRQLTFYLAPIKEEVILGTPFWESMVSLVD